MNEKKICFISCVNNERQYEENLLYIKNLDVPDGYEIETIGIRETKNVAKAYNTAMKMSDAKYKVYSQDHVLIINKNMILDMISIFKSNSRIGSIGVVGTKQIPLSIDLRESPDVMGMIYENNKNNLQLMEFKEVQDQWEVVQAIEGTIIVTQYDLPWREDIFRGNCIYDLAQSIEFRKEGFEVVVPKQNIPWIIKDYINNLTQQKINDYEESRNNFINEYSKVVFPLVSILIPAYNQTKYLKIALESAINQTYKNTEIVICDDSTTEDVKELVLEYMKVTDKIKYFNNRGPLGKKGIMNTEKCFRLANGEYISFLLHDDEYNTAKVEKMISKFLLDHSLSLVTSYRHFINENNEAVYTLGKPTFSKDTKLTGEECGRRLLFTLINFIGELTTVVFRKKDVNKTGERLIGYYGYDTKCLGDISLYLRLCKEGNAFYFTDRFSKFRIHSEQNSSDISITIWSAIDFFNIITKSYEKGVFINGEGELRIILDTWKNFYKNELDSINCIKEKIIDDDNEAFEEFRDKLKQYNLVIDNTW